MRSARSICSSATSRIARRCRPISACPGAGPSSPRRPSPASARACSCRSPRPMVTDGWSDAIARMLVRVRDTAAQVKEGFPHWADPETGRWTTTPDGDWTGGYWIGMLWLAAAAGGDARYRDLAASLAERLRAKIDVDTVFKSFPAYYGAALGAILHDA